MTFDDFVHIFELKTKATSNTKRYQFLSSLELDNVGIYLQDGPSSTDIGIVNLNPSKRTHWVAYISDKYFDSYGCAPPQKLSKFIIKQK